MAEQWIGPEGQESQPKKKKNGCLIAFFIVLAVVLIGAGVAGWLVWKGVHKVKDAFVNEFAENYEQHSGQVLKIADEMSGDQLYLAQTVTISAPNDGSIALVVQTASIEADIIGDVACLSQTLNIEEDVVIHGDLHFVGQNATIKGEVKGEITGSAQVLSVREDLQDRVRGEYQTVNAIPVPAGIATEKFDSVVTDKTTETTETTDETEEAGEQVEDTESTPEQTEESAPASEPTQGSGAKQKKVKK